MIQQGPDPHLDDPQQGKVVESSLQRSIWKLFARYESRKLPSELSFLMVFAYCSLTRGDDLRYDSWESYQQSFAAMILEEKTREESRERELSLSRTDLEPHLDKNIIHLLVSNPAMTVKKANRVYLESISCGRLDLANLSDLNASSKTMRQSVYDWLISESIPFTTKPKLTIPNTSVTKALSRFRSLPDFFLDPEIPPEKLRNAQVEHKLEGFDSILGLVDCTFWGSAKDNIAIGSKGVYFQNMDRFGFLPYSDFPDRTFAALNKAEVSLGRGLSLSTTGSNLDAVEVVAMLQELKREAVAREPGSGRQAGLGDLAGMHSLKEMLLDEVIAPLRDPEKFRRYGISIPNGILMYGPPGCGKTFVAQRLANERNYNFFEVTPGSVGSSYVHGSTLKIQQIFADAKEGAPALLFVDEFEGLVP